MVPPGINFLVEGSDGNLKKLRMVGGLLLVITLMPWEGMIDRK